MFDAVKRNIYVSYTYFFKKIKTFRPTELKPFYGAKVIVWLFCQESIEAARINF